MEFGDTIDCYEIHAPDLFEDPAFVEWLNSRVGKGLATWHTGGEPGEMSDVFVVYDHGEGDEADDMPKHCWDEIDALCKRGGVGHGLLRIVNY